MKTFSFFAQRVARELFTQFCGNSKKNLSQPQNVPAPTPMVAVEDSFETRVLTSYNCCWGPLKAKYLYITVAFVHL